jgi:membrane-bound ClpP family serine protease
VLTLAALVYAVQSGAWSKFSLKSSIQSKVNEGMVDSLKVGDTGKTISVLRPFGKAEFGSSQYEVKTSGGFLEKETDVQIIHIESHQIIVEPLTKI